MEYLIKSAFDHALKWFQKHFNINFIPSLEIGKYNICADLFRVSAKDKKIYVNRDKLFENIAMMNCCLIKKGHTNDEQKEITARFIHEIVETYITTENPGFAVHITPHFHEYADFVEDIYRKENGLFTHAHGYKFLGLEKIFERLWEQELAKNSKVQVFE